MKVTEKMKKAGNNVAAALYNVAVSKAVGKNLERWITDEVTENKDLIQQYIDNKIDSVTVIYMAMERAKKLSNRRRNQRRQHPHQTN